MSTPTPLAQRQRPGRSRAAALCALAGLALLVLIEALPLAIVADPGDRFQAVCFAGFRNYQARLDARLTRPGCRLELGGLGSDAEVDVRVRLARAELPAGLEIAANGRPAVFSLAPGEPSELRLAARTDAQGRLELRFQTPSEERPLAVGRVDVRQPAPTRPPWRRVGAYALTIALCGAGVAWAARRPWGFAAGALGGASLIGLGLLANRLTTLNVLPALLWACGFGLACGRLALRLGAEHKAARFVAAAALLRLGLVLQPGFPCIDVSFHAGTLQEYMAGEPIVGRGPNPDRHAEALPMPYPPFAYALLAPLARAGLARETLVRASLGLLEGSAPLLVLLLARAGGLSGPAAGAAAATAAVMPEGLLVLAKGLLANVLASWAGLAALCGALRRRFLLAAVLLAASGLAHFGHSLLLLPLVAAWLVHARRRGLLDAPAALKLGAALVAALALAWLAYYREVAGLALATAGSLRGSWSAGVTWHGLRWIALGKIVQDLLLKFGLLPLGLAYFGWRAATAAPELRALLRPWLALGAVGALGAVLTPVPLRFEYFLLPAVGLAAGLLAESGQGSTWLPRLALCWRAVFGLQAVLGALLLADRFRLISVILESSLWPFPVRL